MPLFVKIPTKIRGGYSAKRFATKANWDAPLKWETSLKIKLKFEYKFNNLKAEGLKKLRKSPVYTKPAFFPSEIIPGQKKIVTAIKLKEI